MNIMFQPSNKKIGQSYKTFFVALLKNFHDRLVSLFVANLPDYVEHIVSYLQILGYGKNFSRVQHNNNDKGVSLFNEQSY